jgi:hypothetical protein
MEPVQPTAPQPTPKIVAADILSNAIIIAFDNGKEVIYPAEVLYSIAPDELELANRLKKLLR